MDKIQRYPDDTIVLHIRVGDLGDAVVDKELIRKVVRENPYRGTNTMEDPFTDTVEWFPSILNPKHPGFSEYVDRFETFRRQLQSVKKEKKEKFYSWEYLRQLYRMDIMDDVLERGVMINDNIPIPLSYFRILLNSRPWKYIFILTEPGNEENPIIQTILREYSKKKNTDTSTIDCVAQLLRIPSVPDTMAVLMAARHLALSSSTFSIISGLLGVTLPFSSSSIINRTKYIHLPHAGLDTLRSDHETCRLPLVPIPSAKTGKDTEKGSPQFRDIYSHGIKDSSRVPLKIIYHDIYRAGIYRIMKNQPNELNRMMKIHGWTKDTLQRCLVSTLRNHQHDSLEYLNVSSVNVITKHLFLEDVSPYFLSSNELIRFYRNTDCARIFMPSALRNTNNAQSLFDTYLCIDDFLDWSTIHDRLLRD